MSQATGIIERFLRAACREASALSHVELARIVSAGEYERIAAWPVSDPGDLSGDRGDELRIDALEHVRHLVEVDQAPVRCVMRACRDGVPAADWRTSTPWITRPEAESADTQGLLTQAIRDVGALESPSRASAQHMRHNEVMFRAHLQGQGMLMSEMRLALQDARRENAELRKRIADLEASQMAVVRLREELLDGRQLRELELAQVTAGEERKAKFVSEAISLGKSALAARALKAKRSAGVSAPTSADELRADDPGDQMMFAYFKDFIGKLTLPQIKGMIKGGALEPATASALLVFAEAMTAKAETKAEKEKKP